MDDHILQVLAKCCLAANLPNIGMPWYAHDLQDLQAALFALAAVALALRLLAVGLFLAAWP